MPSKKEYFNKMGDSPSNSHWLPWLQKKLIVNNILAQTPEMPVPYLPNYAEWKKVFEQFRINEETILVGHSCGAGFLVRWLSENNIKVDKVALVAPWINPEKDESGKDMFDDLVIDENLIVKAKDFIVYSSDDDADYIVNSVKILKEKIRNLKIEELHNHGHFCLGDMGTREFFKLLKFLLKE